MFWEVFYNLCQVNGRSANSVCSDLGLSTAAATHWKNGSVPKGDVLKKIADYFNVSIDYLMGGSNSAPSAKFVNYVQIGGVNLGTIDRIKELSKERGISLSFICEKMLVNKTYFIDVVKRNGTIPDDKLSIIADVLFTTVEYLKNGNSAPSAKEELGEQQYALYGEIHDLTEEEAQDILNYIKYKKSQRENK